MPTVSRSADGQHRGDLGQAVQAAAFGGSGYGVGIRTAFACIVPSASSTLALIPPPPQSTTRVIVTRCSLPPAAAVGGTVVGGLPWNPVHSPSRYPYGSLMPASESARTDRSRVRLAGTAALAALVLALAGCTSSSGSTPGAGGTGTGSASATPTPDPALAATQPIPFDEPATFSVTNGTLESAEVKGHLHGTPLLGSVQPDGTTWVSDALPTPSASYDVTAQVRSADGSEHTLTGRLVVATLAPANKLGYSVTPFEGWTVGVNAPIVIRFNKQVGDRAAVESALTVSTSTPVVGSWHWVNSVEVHFRPQTAWPAHSDVRVDVKLASVKTGPEQWGATDTTVSFGIGDVHVTKVDGKKHTLTVLVNGRTWAVWPTSLGRPEFVTRTGNYVVLAKQPTRRMTSCNAGITCSKSNPNYYDLTVNWDVRLTYSGTFIHSAPWSVRSQGVDNVSHGCINLSPAHAHVVLQPDPLRRPGHRYRDQPDRCRPASVRRPGHGRLERQLEPVRSGVRAQRPDHDPAAPRRLTSVPRAGLTRTAGPRGRARTAR